MREKPLLFLINRFKDSTGIHVENLSFFKDDTSAGENLLDFICQNELSTWELFICAEAWLELFNRKDKAVMMLKNAENRMFGVSYALKCAELWLKLNDNSPKAENCLRLAESKANRTWDFSTCAEAWKNLFQADEEAVRLLKIAEAKAKTPLDYRGCYEAWKKLLDNYSEAKRLLNIATRKARDFWDLYDCAKAWKELFSDDRQAVRLLRKAESIAHSAKELTACTEFKKIFLEIINRDKNIEESKIKIIHSFYENIGVGKINMIFSLLTGNVDLLYEKIYRLQCHGVEEPV
jgi:tetratricopeptide (TPR) repeat protein